MFITLYVIGSIIGGLTSVIIQRSINVSYIRLVIRLILILVTGLSLINDKFVFLALRVPIGICIGTLQPLNITEAFRLAPHSSRGIIGSLISFYISVGIITGIVLTIPINRGLWSWKVLYVILMGILALTILINLLYLGLNISYYQYVASGDIPSAKRILERYLEQESVDHMIRDEVQYFRLQKEATKKSTLLSTIKTNYRELLVALAVVGCVNVSFANNYGSYMIFFMCNDVTNTDELSTAGMYITIAAGLEIVTKMLYFIFPKIIQRRKRIMVIGLYSTSTLWIMMIFLYISE